jgi:hypothetical protein
VLIENALDPDLLRALCFLLRNVFTGHSPKGVLASRFFSAAATPRS